VSTAEAQDLAAPVDGPPVSPLTVVIPTYNEAANVRQLLDELAGALAGLDSAEVLFVDDSTDGTDVLIAQLAPTAGFPVRVLHREAPEGGLGGAVVAGLRAASTPWCVVMDADLQHPPAVAPLLVAAGERADAALVVASRYAAGHQDAGFAGPIRSLISRMCTRLVRAAFPRTLAGISDPMSGFFAIRRDLWHGHDLQPRGYKILLELAVRTRPATVAEVGYRFAPRHAGESKAGLAEGLRFLRHLITLRFDAWGGRMLAFAAIGASGVLPNLAADWLLLHAGLGYLAAAILANQAAMLWNFLLIDLALFRRRRSRRRAARLGRFALLANADLILRIPLLALLVHGLHVEVLEATAGTLLLASALRFVVTDRLIYPSAGANVPLEPAPMEVP
jgi:dolichol-phosphate mannosyltransferase